ncbi:MAG: iron-sulfur cluster assembly protein [Actinomycetota bacterium]
MSTVHAPPSPRSLPAAGAPDRASVLAAVATVDDPEYPGVSILDLGLFESLSIGPDGQVDLDLVPTFSGCPALAMIAEDVRAAVRTVPGVGDVTVAWLAAPAWTTDRVTARGRAALAQEFTVAVRIGRSEPQCPRCGGRLDDRSLFGPSRCRSVALCGDCRETIEIMRA